MNQSIEREDKVSAADKQQNKQRHIYPLTLLLVLASAAVSAAFLVLRPIIGLQLGLVSAVWLIFLIIRQNRTQLMHLASEAQPGNKPETQAVSTPSFPCKAALHRNRLTCRSSKHRIIWVLAGFIGPCLIYLIALAGALANG
ncbi:MAG: hypothetical protein LBG70_05175 [Bifidobacteriaceae bacterium]|nr:hypothetical protein [Bifidobacteriaceae bacterium]